jgi:hypothetical protein
MTLTPNEVRPADAGLYEFNLEEPAAYYPLLAATP